MQSDDSGAASTACQEEYDALVTKLCSVSSVATVKQLYLGGAGGCGKSTVISCIRHFAKSWGLEHTVHVSAYTGAAAMNVGGTTIHSHASIPVKYAYAPANNVPAKTRLEANSIAFAQLIILIIDEISLVSAQLLGLYDECLRVKTGRDLPFGGALVIFSGVRPYMPCTPPPQAPRLNRGTTLTCFQL